MAILVRDDNLDCFGLLRIKFGSDKNGLAFYPWADGSPLNKVGHFRKSKQTLVALKVP